MPTVKVAQQNVKSHILTSFNDAIISRKLKFFSEPRGALIGNLACTNAFSLSVSHFAVGGTASVNLASGDVSKWWLTVWKQEEENDTKYYCDESFD